MFEEINEHHDGDVSVMLEEESEKKEDKEDGRANESGRLCFGCEIGMDETHRTRGVAG